MVLFHWPPFLMAICFPSTSVYSPFLLCVCLCVHVCVHTYMYMYICMLWSAVTDKDVMDLEKTYWGLKSVGREKSGKFDLETFKFYASPPVPEEVCGGMYICVYTA